MSKQLVEFTCVSLIILGISGCRSITEDRSRENILDVLRADKAAGNKYMGHFNKNTKIPELAVGIKNYCKAMDSYDLSNCPSDFTVAYRRHIQAWWSVANVASRYPEDFQETVGFVLINMLDGDFTGGGFRLLKELDEAYEQVKITWEEVEQIGFKYGAAL